MHKVNWSKIYSADNEKPAPSTGEYITEGKDVHAHNENQKLEELLIRCEVIEKPTPACGSCIYFQAANQTQHDIDIENEIGRPGYIRELKAKIKESERNQKLLRYAETHLQTKEREIREELNHLQAQYNNKRG